MKIFYDSPIKRPPFGLSDHVTVEVQPLNRPKNSETKVVVMSRDLQPSKRLAFGKYIEEVNVKYWVESVDSCDDKTKMLEHIINFDFLLPIKKKILINNEPPWMTKSLKELIHRMEKAFAQNDLDSFKKLRNQVNRERKSCRKRFYRNKVKHLKSCSPATWWKEIKKFSGVSLPVPSQEDTMSILHNIDKESLPSDHIPEQLANMINESFVTPTKAFNPLLPHLRLDNEDDNFLSLLPVTEFSAFKMLSTLNARKVTGSDGIPAWVLKENADILASLWRIS
jgi:hypothetical protein